MVRVLLLLNLFVVSLSAFAATNEDIAKQLNRGVSIKLDKAYEMDKEFDLGKIRYIAIPDDAKFKNAAQEIKAFLQEKNISGVNIISADDFQKINGNAIIIGDINNNRVMERLYWNYYTRMVPGVLSNKGYAIQTVYNPLPILPQSNLILIGVKHPNMLSQAVDSFKEIVNEAQSNKLDPMYKLYGGAVMRFRDSYYDQFTKAGGIYGFVMLMEYYMRNCDQKYFDKAFELLYEKAQENIKDPLRLAVNWNDELHCFKAIQYWDSFARLSNLTDQQRLDIDRMFVNSINVFINRCSGYHEIDEDYIITWNHTNIPLLDIYTISRYLKNRYGLDEELKEYFQKTHDCFDKMIENYRPMEESIGYTLLASEYCMYYYLMEDKKEFLESGNARRLADLAFIQIDNNGHMAGQGDTGQTYGLAGHNAGFAALYYFLKEGEFPYVAERVKSFRFKLNTLFDPGIKHRALERYVGLKYIPVDKGMYELCQNYSYEYEPPSPPDFPREMTFDKLQFRSSAKPEGEYLLLDGLGRGKHQHYDTNAIVCYTAMGYKFLIDADYLCKKTSDHSIINVCKDGRSEDPIPSCAGLLHAVEFDNSAYTSSLVTNYKGVDWNRNIYWEKEKFFAVIDTVRAKEAGEYVFDSTWKVLDRGMEEYDGQNLICKAPIEGSKKLDPIKEFPEQTFYLRSTDDGGWWDHRLSSYKLPSHRIHNSRKENMQMGDYCSYQNVFYVKRQTESGAMTDYYPSRLNERTMLIDSADGIRLLMVDDAKYEDISLRGKFAAIGTDKLLGVSISAIRKDGKSLFYSDVPVTVNIEGGKLKIEAKSKGYCKVLGNDKEFAFDKGVTEYPGVRVRMPISKSQFAVNKKKTAEKKEESLFANVKDFEILWQSPQTGFKYNSGSDVAVGDFTGDRRNEIIVTSNTGQAVAYDINGKELWKYSEPSGIFSATIGDLNKDGKNEVFLGTGDHTVVMLDGNGKEMHTLEVPIESSGRYGSRARDPHWITVMNVRDINKDGRMELIVATRTWQAQIFDDQFNQLWYFTYLYHGVLELQFTDMDNDGVEDILAADRYGTTRILDWRDKDWATSIKSYTAVGDTSTAWTDVNKDGLKQMLNASGSGNLASFERPKELKIRVHDSWDPYFGYNKKWEFNNFGYSYTDIDVLRGTDGSELVLAASETGYVYCVDPVDGKQLWSTYLGSMVHCLTTCGSKYILAGTEKGDVFMLSDDGTVLRKIRVDGRVNKIKQVDRQAVAAFDTYGNVSVMKW